MADSRLTCRLAGLIAIASAAFTWYGSLVPLEFRSRSFSEAFEAFRWAMTQRWWYESRSDAVVNVMLGIPLGFGLLGFMRAGQNDKVADVITGALLLPVCLVFAAAVEFTQLYTLTRTTAGSDVLCQGFGAVIGMAVWVFAGSWLMGQVEDTWIGTEPSGRILVAYLVLLAFTQLLPLDLTASPREVYRKLRDRVVYVPFQEFQTTDPAAPGVSIRSANPWERPTRLLEVFGLYLPAGLLAFRVRLLHGKYLILFALAVPFAMECMQLLVMSRFTSMTDVVVGAAGILAGAVLAHTGGWLAFLTAWLVAMGIISWQPFQLAEEMIPFSWVPGAPLNGGHPLFALEEIITKLMLFGLGGAIIRIRWTFAFGLIFSGILEGGQTVFQLRTPCVTDVLLGGAGMWIGSLIRRRVEQV